MSSNNLKTTHLAWGSLLIMGLIHGYNWVVMKSALKYTDPAIFAAMRCLLGSLLLFILVILLRKPLRPTKPLLTAITGVFSVLGTTTLALWALQHGQAGKTSILLYTMPIWILFLAWIILGERIRKTQWPFIIAALAGLLLVISPWSLEGDLFSNIMGLGAGFCSAVSSIAAKAVTKDKSVDLLSFNAWQMLFGCIPVVIIAFISFETGPEWSGWFVATLLYNVVLASPVALFLWFFALRHLSAGSAGLGRLTTPIIGVLTAWIQLGEQPSAYEAIGMTLIIAALIAIAGNQISAEKRG